MANIDMHFPSFQHTMDNNYISDEPMKSIYHFNGGNNISPISMNHRQFEDLEKRTSELKKHMENKAINEYAKIEQTAKLEQENIPNIHVATKTIPVAVSSIYGGATTIMNTMILCGILLLVYILWILYQPNLSGTWINDDNKLIITHNRLTGNVKLECSSCFANPQYGYVTKKGNIILNTDDSKFGSWDHKNTIITSYKTMMNKLFQRI